MPNLTPVPVVCVECIVSPVAFVIGEHEGCATRGVGSNPPRLPNISLPGKEIHPTSVISFKITVTVINPVSNQDFDLHLQVMVLLFVWKNPLHVWIGIKSYG